MPASLPRLPLTATCIFFQRPLTTVSNSQHRPVRSRKNRYGRASVAAASDWQANSWQHVGGCLLGSFQPARHRVACGQPVLKHCRNHTHTHTLLWGCNGGSPQAEHQAHKGQAASGTLNHTKVLLRWQAPPAGALASGGSPGRRPVLGTASVLASSGQWASGQRWSVPGPGQQLGGGKRGQPVHTLLSDCILLRPPFSPSIHFGKLWDLHQAGAWSGTKQKKKFEERL